MLRLAASALVLCFAIAFQGDALAHGGGLDRNGCHNDRRNGGYHCHRGESSTPRGLVGPAPRSMSPAQANAHDAELVKSAQLLLNHLGCDAGDVDGGQGPQTRAAIGRFQQATTGVWGEPTIDAAFVRRLSEAVTINQRCW